MGSSSKPAIFEPRETAISEDRSTHDSAEHDAQRELEQKALRNVRGLVERMEADERAKSRSQKWVVGVLLTVVAVLGVIMVITLNKKSSDTREIVIVPASTAPAR